jgi:protein-S-isoprenylcysteine O-methyltransferase Ste14
VTTVNTKAWLGLSSLIGVLGLLLFVPAGSLFYWQAWVWLILFSLSTGAITRDLMTSDPALLARRLHAGPSAEKEPRQQVIQALASVAFLAIFLVSAFDHRFGWSAVPLVAVVVGDVMLVAGLFMVFLVFRANTFAAATVDVDNAQRVIATGPYAVVRHPMYSGALLMLLGTPPALGSWWGFLAVALLAAVIIWRLCDEEAVLARRLPGYAAYRVQVRWRLIPGIF